MVERVRRSGRRSARLKRRVPIGAQAAEILEATKGSKTNFVVVRDIRILRELADILKALAPNRTIACLPEWDCLPGDHVSPSLGVMGERTGTLRWLASRGYEPSLVLVTVPALCQRIPPSETWGSAHLEIVPGQDFDPDHVASGLERLGYVREERVEEPGQFAVHGQTLEVYPAAAACPCRIEHGEGCVTEIRSYDVDTQRSLATSDVLVIDPASEIILPEGTERPRPFAGEEHRLAAYYPQLESVTDYLPDAPMLLDAEADERAELFFEQLAEGCQSSDQSSSLYLDRAAWAALVSNRASSGIGRPNVETNPNLGPGRGATARFRRFVEERRKDGDTVVLTGEGIAFRRFSSEAEKSLQCDVRTIGTWDEIAAPNAGEVLLLQSPIIEGFRSTRRGMTIVAAAEVYGARLPAGGAERSLPGGEGMLRVGDVAVDRENGLCVFEGLETVGTDQGGSDAIRLRFVGDNTALVPVEQVDRVWRYGSEPEAVTLDRLGGSAWETRRIEVEGAIARTARAMTALARSRASARTKAIRPYAKAMERFASGFPFPATSDQVAAIDDVLADLAATKPMDRLICGDVGFGKTEVALRAVAAAVFAGRQAAIVAPTTILARQHADTLRRRFASFGVEVGHLSRIVSASEARRTRAGMADGSIQVVVGTQALAGKGIAFADLAVTVIDEEQRFGSKLKGRLRNLGGSGPGHILTVTATPIPRTLQEAMSGLQSLSLLVTPPATRLPIRTVVRTFDATVVAEALAREKARGGQSFVVCPRIEDLEPIRAQIAAAAPQLDIATAHGKLKPAEMDDRVVRFAEGEGDVLLATSIIESGLDIPLANTMIVYDADRFGLAELHQLRGRVGRGQRRGVVYLLADVERDLNPVAARRLSALAKLDRLGAGFAIAGRDLDLRGAGDLFGEEQAGHVQKIGSGLYQHLLELALAAAGGRPLEDWSPELSVGPKGHIPAGFVPDAETRVDLYKRLFRSRTGEEIAAWLEELDDRFGEPPRDVGQLVQFARLRAACRRLGVARLSVGPEGFSAEFRPDRNRPRVVERTSSRDGRSRLALAGAFLARLDRGLRRVPSKTRSP